MLKPGLSAETEFTVTEALTATAVGSGTLEVLATPVMLANMEKAAWTAVAPALSPEESTVGTRIDVRHLSPTPIGLSVTCAAELLEVDGRRLLFRVTAYDGKGIIGEGTHERVMIQSAKFVEKARKKL